MKRASIRVSTRNEESDEDSASDSESVATGNSTRIVQPLPFKNLYAFKCGFPACPFICRRHEAMETHLESKHNCQHCGLTFFNLRLHYCPRRGQRGGHVGPVDIDESFFQESSRSHRGTVINYTYEVDKNVHIFDNIYEFFDHIHDPLVKLLEQNIQFWRGIVIVYRQYTELQDLKTLAKDNKYLGTSSIILRHENRIEPVVHYIQEFLLAQLDIYNSNGSGYKITGIDNAIVTIGEYKPIRVRGYIPTPVELKGRHGLLNIRGQMDLCFKYCICSNFFKNEVAAITTRIRKMAKWPLKGSTYKSAIKRALECGENYEQYFTRFIWDGLDFPISIDEIHIFEENNNISVNVFRNEGKDMVWIRETTLESEKHVDLLLVTDEDDSHFILIHDRPAFEGKNGQSRHCFCTFCQKRFLNKNSLAKHRKVCFNLNQGIMEFPKVDFYVFKKYEMTMKFPFTVYYDWETWIIPEKAPHEVNDKESFTRKTALLDPSGYSFCLVGPEGFMVAEVYDGPNAIDHFIKMILFMADKVLLYLKGCSKKMNPTPEDLERHRVSTHCMMCKMPFTKKRYKVLHHDHITSKVIGSLDNACNLKIKFKKVLPALCHNGTNFDHAIICRGFKYGVVSSVSVIPKNSEKYLGFIVNRKVKFLDSCQFLPKSLSALTLDLKKSGIDKFKCTRKYFNKDDNDVDELIIQKQVYAYDYMTGPEVYDDLTLPPKEKYGLNGRHITDKEYKHAQKVWKEFNCKTYRDYTRIYSISDSLLLADIFENFRDTAFETQSLDPLYVWSSPGFTWECALFSSKVQLEYIKNFEILEMLEEGIRGGPTFVTERIVTANNEALGEEWPFDPTKPRKYILYSDLNALYSWCMTQKLGYKDFRMLTTDEIEKLDVMNIDPDADTSYILVVDLDYPESLHDIHDDLPLAVEKRRVQVGELSPTQGRLADMYSSVIKKPLGGEKLIMTLYPKKKYICYLKTLQFYVKQGLVITKIHKGFSFTQGYVFRDYVLSNIKKRSETTSELMRDLYKLLNNSLYGRTLTNTKNYVDVKFCLTREQTVKELAKPNLKSFIPLTDDITVCHLSKTKIVCNSFFYLGFVILELAKLRLYDGYYNGIKKAFRFSSVIYGDTDSIVNVIEDPDNTFQSDLAKLSSWYDFSNLEKEHPLYNVQNKDIPGLWKIVITDPVEMVAISSKMYSVLRVTDLIDAKKHAQAIAEGIHDQGETRAEKKELMRKGKGIGKRVLEKLQHEHYKKCIFEYNKIFQIRMQGIRQYRTELSRVELRKIGFHALDTKRFILRGGIKTLAFGNYNITRIVKEELSMCNDIVGSVDVQEIEFDVSKDTVSDMEQE